MTFTATVTGKAGAPAPTGTVTFFFDCHGSAPVALDANGVATLTTSSLTVGSHQVYADYNGNSTYYAASSLFEMQVVTGPSGTPGTPSPTVGDLPTSTNVCSAPNPAVFSQAVTFLATVSGPAGAGTPTGSVTFSVDGCPPAVCNAIGTAPLDANGQAALTTSSLDIGTHTVTAVYNGDQNFASSGGTLPGGQVVDPALTTTSLISGDDPSLVGQPVTFTATASPVPPASGTLRSSVSFYVDCNPQSQSCTPSATTGPLDANQQASATISGLPAGTHTIRAEYRGGFGYSVSVSSPITQTVQTPTTTSVSSLNNPSAYGQSVTLTAMVTPAPSSGGTVAFDDGGQPISGCGAQPVSTTSGQATCTTSSLPAGMDQITAVYSGAGEFAGSTEGPLAQVITPAVTSLSAHPAQLGLLSITLSATLTASGTPVSGEPVVFSVAGHRVCQGTTNGSGVASCTAFPALIITLGATTYAANFTGDVDYLPSSANGQLTSGLVLLGLTLNTRSGDGHHVAVVRATLSRRGLVYATGVSRTGRPGVLMLKPRRPLHSGRYTLTESVGAKQARRTVMLR